MFYFKIDEVLNRSIHSLDGNVSYYGVQILHSQNITYVSFTMYLNNSYPLNHMMLYHRSLLQPIPVLITLVSEGGNNNLFLALKAILKNVSYILAERTNLVDPVIIKEQNIVRFGMIIYKLLLFLMLYIFRWLS